MLRYKVSFLLASSFSMAVFAPLATYAATSLSDSEVVGAVERAHILDPSIRINARVSADEIMVATYKNPKAADTDCKIEAVLVAKAVMDLSPGNVPRVTVYFYDTSSLGNFKEVTITAGDVKAFASGSLSKDELIASIKVRSDAISDPKKRVDEHMQEAASRRSHRVSSVIHGDEVLIKTIRDASMSDRSLKYEAFSLTENAFEASPAEVKKVVVAFEFVGKTKRAEVITFNREDFGAMQKSLIDILDPLKIEIVTGTLPGDTPSEAANAGGGRIDVQTLTAAEGPLRDERSKLLERLKALNSAGVGYGAKPLDDFMTIEASVGSASEAEQQERISQLSELIGKFEQNLKGAKEHKAVGASKASTQAVSTGASDAGTAGSGTGAGSIGDIEGMKKQVLANPDLYISNMAAGLVKHNIITGEVIGKYKTPEDHPNFQKNLQFVIDTLKANNRGAEAVKYEQRLDTIRAKQGH